jgi:hypothetical protein
MDEKAFAKKIIFPLFRNRIRPPQGGCLANPYLKSLNSRIFQRFQEIRKKAKKIGPLTFFICTRKCKRGLYQNIFKENGCDPCNIVFGFMP